MQTSPAPGGVLVIVTGLPASGKSTLAARHLPAGGGAAPGAPADRFLDLPGPRLVYDPGRAPPAAALEAVLAELESWLARA